jgi:hypothetical protein
MNTKGFFMNKPISYVFFLVLIAFILPGYFCTSSEQVSSGNSYGSTNIATATAKVARITSTPQKIEPTITPIPEIVELSIYEDSIFLEKRGSNLYIFALVENSGNVPIKQPSVTGTLYDADGNVLITDFSYIKLPWSSNLWNTAILFPGEVAGFYNYYSDISDWATYDFKLALEKATESEAKTNYEDLTLTNMSSSTVSGFIDNFRIGGTVTNSGEKTVRSVWVCAYL